MGEGLKHFLGERRSFALVLCLKQCEEIVGQRRDVFAAFAQWRQIERDDIDAIEEILAKTAGDNFVGEIAIGGTDDTCVGAALLSVADAVVGAVLKKLKRLGLEAHIELGDFVEEERAVVGQFDETRFGGIGVGEGALFVAEEFAFEERARDGGAVDLDTGARGES